METDDGDYIPWDEPRVRESLANCAHPKEMVAVAMRRIDGNQVLPLFSTHSASCRFCSTVMNVSTKTASCLPEMSIDDIGDHLRFVTPGDKSAVTTWGWVLTIHPDAMNPSYFA
jgi:hypothetical protein